MKLTVICHIYNEAFILPFWLKHHREMFDHGIIIDYHSTDNSLEIVREITPSWDIVATKNQYFVEPDIGNEVEDYEQQIDGWKMALNVSEFLLCTDLHLYCKELEANDLMGIQTNGVVIVDRIEERGQYTDDPLVLQKTFGYFENDLIVKPLQMGRPVRSRSRLLHRAKSGGYTPGRHGNKITDKIDPNFFLCWFGWAPFTEEFKNRKLQIQHKVSDKQKEIDYWARTYVIDDARVEDMYAEQVGRSYDLLEDNSYQLAYNNYRVNKKYSG